MLHCASVESLHVEMIYAFFTLQLGSVQCFT